MNYSKEIKLFLVKSFLLGESSFVKRCVVFIESKKISLLCGKELDGLMKINFLCFFGLNTRLFFFFLNDILEFLVNFLNKELNHLINLFKF